jgi:transcriptional regulator with GAF, ATPase, and Fis domain
VEITKQYAAPQPEIAPEPIKTPTRRINFNSIVARFECRLIERALRESNGELTGAARSLGLVRTTLSMKLTRYGINRLSFKRPIF